MERTISAIIPTKNRHDILPQLLASFIAQKIETPLQFIIVDQSETHISEEEIRRLESIALDVNDSSWVEYYYEPGINGLTQAKNYGIDRAKNDLCLFLDDDVILMPGFLKEIEASFNDGYDGVSGVQIQDSVNKSSLSVLYNTIFHRGFLKDDRRKINKNYWKYKGLIHSRVLSGGLTAYKREVFNKVKFDENLIRYCLGEDKEFSLRASHQNFKLAINADAYVFHFRHPKGKPNLFGRYQGKTALIKYLNSKNLKGDTGSNMAANWAITGIFLEAAVLSILKFNATPIKGAMDGLKRAKEGYEGLQFIKIKKGEEND